MNEKSPPPTSPSRLRRWWRRLWRLAALGCLLLAALLWWAWRERVPLVNALLARAGGDTRVQIAALEWDNGLLRVRNVSATHLPTAQRVGEAGDVEWRLNWGQLWNRNLGSVKVTGGSMDAALALFATQQQQNPGGDGAPAAPPSAALPWRLESLDLASTQIVLRDEARRPLLSVTVHGSLRGGSTEISFESTRVEGADLRWQGKTVTDQFHMDAVMKDGRIEIQKVSLHGGRFDLAWLKGLYPLLEGGVELDWEGTGLVLSRDAGLVAGGTHEVQLKNLLLKPSQGAGLVKAEAASFRLSQHKDGRWQVARGVIAKPEVEWTPELESVLLAKKQTTATAAHGPPAAPAQPWQILAAAVEVKDGRVTLHPTPLNPLAGSFQWNAALENLQLSAAGLRSSARQKLELRGLALRWGRTEAAGTLPPFVAASKVAAEAVPDELIKALRFESLQLAGLQVTLTPENGPWFDKVAVPAPAPAPASANPPWWQRLSFGTLEARESSIALALNLAERLEASAQFDIVTDGAAQRLTVTNGHALIPSRASLPVVGVEKLEAVAVLPEMWQQRRVESLKIRAGYVDVGDALMSLFDAPGARGVEAKADAAAARWTAGSVEVGKVGVTILNLGPGLPPVRFDVNFSANETPLDLDGLAENVEPQRVVLSRLRIPSPHEPLRTVAEMDTIYVGYTLDGLLHRRIDRVDIISPLLYVGEDLFWYVENYRKFMKGEAPPADASAGPPAPPTAAAAPGWHVETLAVEDGRLLLAPKGVPLAGFSRPFPFSFTSKLESGQLDAVFDIPTDDYTLKDLKIEFRQMKGQVRFNLPMKDRNNNLTETFTVEQLRWKELHVEKAHLSVTYDANGIYGQFGGQAYGGYVNGAFDIYLDEAYTWDGWVSGADVALGPVTKALFPKYFVLSGSAGGKVIATGNMHELYQGDVEFANRTRGKFSIEALNEAIKELPPVLQGDISQQIRRIGLETLRQFDYDRMDAKARFYGREGHGYLRFTGPQGARTIDVNVYDHRWKEEPRKSETAAAAEP